jgi:primosomal replication protein N
MNTIKLKGILTNVAPSHEIGNVEFCKANMLVKRVDGREDLINIRFKKFSNPYNDGQEISLSGNIRSYSSKLENGKNKVDLYVFTYFDIPDLNENDQEDINSVEIDGRICKIEPIRTTRSGKRNIHFILANNLIVSDGTKKLNSYIPCIAWGEVAEQLSALSVNSQIVIKGGLHSREYQKLLPNGESEIRVAHECVVTSINIL